MKKILVAEDEDNIREFIVLNLIRAGYSVTDVKDGAEALKVFRENPSGVDVAVLDVMMPNVDGFEVCKALREESEQIGILMLTAKTQELDKVNGLMLGADDYMTKPFGVSELVARVDALHRRVLLNVQKSMATAEILRSGPFTLDLKSRSFTKDSKPLDLTQVEFQLMEFFLKNPNIAFERKNILTEVWGGHYAGDDKIVDVNIRRLRMKIEDDPSEPKYLTTVWGFGYKWNG